MLSLLLSLLLLLVCVLYVYQLGLGRPASLRTPGAAPRRPLSGIHPVLIPRIRCPRFVPRVGLHFKAIRTLSALRISKGWVREEPNLGMRIGICSTIGAIIASASTITTTGVVTITLIGMRFFISHTQEPNLGHENRDGGGVS